MKVSELAEMYDTRKEGRREHGDHNWHQAIANKEEEFWLMQGDKKLSGPFKSHEKAESFKKNRPDKIPASATIKKA